MGDFRKNTPADCFPTLKKKRNLLLLFILEKTSYTVDCRGKISSTRDLEKKILPKPNHPYPDLKVNWSAHYPRDDVKQTNKNKPRSSSKLINP